MSRVCDAFDVRAFATSLVVSAVPIVVLVVAAGYPAMQDFGGWLYQGHVLAWVWSGQASAFKLAPYPVPYAAAQAVLGALNMVLPPIAAALVYLVVYVLLGAVAVSLFVRRYRLARVAAGVFLTVTTVLGSGFWNGYVGTQLGGILLVLYLALDRRVVTSLVGVLVSSLVMFSVHAISFAVWGLVALVLAIFARRVWQFVGGVLPALALLAWYAHSSVQPSTGVLAPEGPFAFVAYKAYTLLKFAGYQNFIVDGVGDYSQAPALYWAGIAVNILFVLVFLAAVVWMLLRNRDRLRLHRAEAVALLALTAVMLAMPRFAFGIVNPGERIGSAVLALAVIFALPAASTPALITRLLMITAAIGLVLCCVSAALLPAKKAQGEAHRGTDTRTLAHSLLGHRTDELAAAMDAARDSARRGAAPRFPLVWQTSILLERTPSQLTSWQDPYGDVGQ